MLFDTLPSFATDSAAALQAWRAETLDDEHRAANRPADLSAPWGGHWWSTPALAGLTRSTRSLPVAGPVGLALVEDRMGWTSATVEDLSPQPDVRVYEIDGPIAWTELVGRYPLTVTNSRRHDWWKITRRAGDWLLPDYHAVAVDYDAVHLSVYGYLSSAGRALDVGGATSVLAGWDPDATWWLTDSFTTEVATFWSRSENDTPLGWHLQTS